MYEFILPIYYYEEAITKRRKLQTILRNSFKSFTGLRKTVKTELIDSLMAYNIDKRSRQLQHTSYQKWIFRTRGQMYDYNLDPDDDLARPNPLPNLCKNQPKSMIKYINMQTSLCPTCKTMNIITRCSKEHLEKSHNIKIDAAEEIMKKVTDLTKKAQTRRKEHNDETSLTRKILVEYADNLIQPNLKKLKDFLCISSISS